MRALFLGGTFDMTTMELNEELYKFRFYEPVEEPIKELINLGDPLLCNDVIYELVYKTPKDVLIYEFVGD